MASLRSSLRRSTLIIATLIALVASLSSCTVDNGSLSAGGNWSLTYINNSPVYTDDYDYCEFQFYSNGTGYYSFYDDFGRWSSLYVTWDVDYSGYRDILYVYPSNGQNAWIYNMDRSYNTLYLQDLVTGNRLTFTRN